MDGFWIVAGTLWEAHGPVLGHWRRFLGIFGSFSRDLGKSSGQSWVLLAAIVFARVATRLLGIASILAGAVLKDTLGAG